MASTETRSGFRLPWSSDRSRGEAATESTSEPTPDAADPKIADPAIADPTTDATGLAWPETDLNARPPFDSPEPGAPEAELEDGPTAEESPMPDTNPVTSALPVTPKKPSKLMSDLSAAIRSTAEAARDQALAQADADARQAKETIRERSTEGAAALRQRSDEDIAGIRDWSKAEIARLREETDQKVANRKATLEDELGEHAASVERRIGDVDAEVSRHQEAMDAYLERLRAEEDPARLATLAETMPEAPSFDAWLQTTTEANDEGETEANAEAEMAESFAEAETDETDETALGEVDADTMGEAEPLAEADSMGEVDADTMGEAEPLAVTDETEDEGTDWSVARDVDGQPEPVADWGAATTDGEPEATNETETPAATQGGAWGETETPAPTEGATWGEPDGDWTTPAPTDSNVAGEDVPRWAAGETPEGFPTSEGAGDPVDRGAIMAALEAAAEAVVAAESASESADQAEAAADVAETAAELFRGQHDHQTASQEAPAPDAVPYAADVETESFAGRLASLLPGHGGGGDANGEPQTSRVVATGLVSVASIASFKRHLGRVAGVQGVSVSSGPDGEFVFSVIHRPDVAFRDVIPTLPGFAARVVSAEDGLIRVTAQDPEAGA